MAGRITSRNDLVVYFIKICDKIADYYLRFYDVDKKYKMAACLSINKFSARIKILNLNREIIKAKN